jgi:hypothetical protein
MCATADERLRDVMWRGGRAGEKFRPPGPAARAQVFFARTALSFGLPPAVSMASGGAHSSSCDTF